MAKSINKILILSAFLFLFSASHAFAANRYWVGGTGNWSDDDNHWSTTDGGAPGDGNVPSGSDNVIFNTNSGSADYTVTVTSGATSLNLTASAPSSGNLTVNVANTFTVNGSFTLYSGLVLSNASTILFSGSGTTKTVTMAGTTYAGRMLFNTSGAKWTLQDTFSITDDIQLTAGTLDTNGQAVTARALFTFGSSTKVLTFGASVITLTGSSGLGNVVDFSGGNLTVNANTSTIKLTDSSTSTKTIGGNGKTFNKIWIATGSTGSTNITGSNTYDEIYIDGNDRIVKFTAGTTQTFTSAGPGITTNGTGITLGSITSATHTLTKPSGTVSISNTTLSYSVAQGGAPWRAYTSNTNVDGGNNSGWFFTPFSISGTANGNNGATVKVAINGTVQAQTGTIASSAWSIASVTEPSVNDIITVWVDGATAGDVSDANESTAVTKYNAGDVTGMVLNTGVLTVGSSQNTSVSTTNMTQYENSDDEDVMHSSTSGALTVDAGGVYSGETLSILASNTLTVASASTETVTTEKITNAGTITSTGSPTYTLTGTSGTLFTNTGTFTADSSTVTMNPDGAVTLTSGSITFYNLTLNPTITSSRVYTFGSSALAINGDFNINPTAGSALSLTVNAGANITVASGKTTTISRANSATSILDMRPSASDYDLSTGLLNVATGGTLDLTSVASETALTLTATSGTLFTLAGTFTITSGTPTVVMSGNGDATINSGAITFYNLTSSGTGTKTLGAAIEAGGALTISAGTFAGSSYTITLSGTGTVFNNTATYSAGTSTIKFTNNSSSAKTFAGGGSTFNNFWYAPGSGTGSLTITGSNTFADFKDDGTAAHSILFTTGTTQTVTTFTVNGTAGNLITINSTDTGTHALVKSGGGTITSDYLSIQHSVATPTSTWLATNSTNNQAVTTAGSGWYFGAFNANPDTPTSLGATAYVNGSLGNDNTPTLTFTLADSDVADTVKFQIQIDDSSDFASAVVDYTSALAAQGSASFTVGQAAGSGTYTTGSSGQTLNDTSYYWRVKAIDNSDAASSYATANSGSVAFILETVVPTITNVSSDKTNGTYTTGEVIDIDVTFSEAVTSTGNVTVTLETGTTDRTCTFTVSASTTGTCNYTVQAGDTTSDLTVSTISGTIADAATNAVSDFAPATNLAANKALVIDTTAPTITNNTYTLSSPNTVTITWTTNEIASSLVNYGPTSSYGTATDETDTSPRVTSHSVAISGITNCATYYYSVESKDSALNTTSSENSFFAGFSCGGGGGAWLYSISVPPIINQTVPTINSVPLTSSCPILPNTPKLLKLNITNPTVKILQQVLNCKGFIVSSSGGGSKGEETNYFGAKTKDAVRRFQKAHNLKIDGIVGPATRAELNKVN